MQEPSRSCAVLIGMLIGCLTVVATAQERAAGESDSDDQLAIVPFSNITGETGDAWIGIGIAETLVTGLQADPSFTVVGRELVSEAMAGLPERAAGDDTALLALGRRVGARWVVSGGYQHVGSQIRITARLVEVSTGTVARSAKVDGAVIDLFDLQDAIAAQLLDGVVTTVVSPPVVAAPSSVIPASPSPDVTSVGTGRPGAVAAMPSTGTAAGAAMLELIDGPPPPVAPSVMNRDEQGRTTVRAVRLTDGIRLDGQLDEEVYQTVPPITDFIQQVPDEGEPATERTEAWIMFDDTSVYVSARVHDSAPESEWVANEMRRDHAQLRENDNFAAFFDTFYDRRNGYNFHTNPLGARTDQQITNEGNPNRDWNPVWDVRTGRFDEGWTVEMEIPFKTFRYRSGTPQLWGVQLRRSVRRKNEWVYLTRIPVFAGSGGGSSAIFRVSAAATLIGLEPPPSSRLLEIKPYAIGGSTTDVGRGLENDPNGDFGVDAKYGITRNLTADLTYNPDFAQVEVDEQQVNLTRFSLFFPEKREFFLEGRGIFGFARAGLGGGGFGGGGGGFFGGGGAPTIFYSRRIGLERGTVVPIYGGGRVTGKVGAFDVGALNIQTEDSLDAGTDSTNFTVLRVRRDILRRSGIGGIFTNRSVSTLGPGTSQAYGLDATFAFYDNVNFLAYYAKTRTPGNTDKDNSYQGRFNYGSDRYGFTADHIVVEDNFIPEVGFVRRDNFKRTNVIGRFSPRPRTIESVRQFTFEGSIDYYVTADRGGLETRERRLDFRTELENSDTFGATLSSNFERLDVPFEIGPGVILPVGG